MVNSIRLTKEQIVKRRAEGLRKAGLARYIKRLNEAGFDYVGGYTGTDGKMIVAHRECGRQIEISCQRVRKGKCNCDLCRDEETERRKEQKSEELIAERQAKAEARKAKAEDIAREKEEKRNRICLECGASFVSSCRRYCSPACASRAANRRKEAKRRGYRSIVPLTELYEKHGGRCYICGTLCDYNDYTVVDGAYHIGEHYPTVEHIIPLSKGGWDGWDNVALACHRCNTKKSINSFVKVGRDGQIQLEL